MLLREELADAVELPVPAWRPSMVPLPAALLSESCLSCLSCSCFCLRICESRFSKPLSCVGGTAIRPGRCVLRTASRARALTRQMRA